MLVLYARLNGVTTQNKYVMMCLKSFISVYIGEADWVFKAYYVVCMYIIRFNNKNSAFCLFICLIYFSQQTTVVFLHRIYRFVFLLCYELNI